MYSASPMMTRMLCSMTSSVMPSSALIRRSRSMRSLIKVGLIPAVGSSRSSMRGSLISAIANSRSFCWPKERSRPRGWRRRRRNSCEPAGLPGLAGSTSPARLHRRPLFHAVREARRPPLPRPSQDADREEDDDDDDEESERHLLPVEQVRPEQLFRDVEDDRAEDRAPERPLPAQDRHQDHPHAVRRSGERRLPRIDESADVADDRSSDPEEERGHAPG